MPSSSCAKTDASVAALPLRQVIQGCDANLPVAAMMTMEENVGHQFLDTKIISRHAGSIQR